jgi:hypothetical protein
MPDQKGCQEQAIDRQTNKEELSDTAGEHGRRFYGQPDRGD